MATGMLAIYTLTISMCVPVVGPGFVSTSPARRRRRRMPMMLLLDHIFLHRFAWNQRDFLLQVAAFWFGQLYFITDYISNIKCIEQ